MQTMTRRALAVGGHCIDGDGFGGVGAAGAAGARPRRDHKVDGNTLTVKSRDGAERDGEARRAAADRGHGQGVARRHQGRLVHRRLGDAAAGRHAEGLSASTSSWTAQKGVVADRFSDWDSRPGSTMTNANVATTVAGKDGQDLLVKYKDGEKKVIVPPGTPIAKYAPGSAADLKVGEKGLRRRRQEGGRRHADRAEHRGWPRHRSAAVSGGMRLNLHHSARRRFPTARFCLGRRS